VRFQFGDFGGIDDIGLGLRWSNAQFAAEVADRAARLAGAGIAPGSMLVIAHSGTAHFFADLFAVWQLGCTAACVGDSLTAAELDVVADFVRPAAILAGQTLPALQFGGPILRLVDTSRAATVAAQEIDPRRAALVLFTSGTTGAPKGVVLSFGAILTRAARNAQHIGAACRSRALVTLPTSFGHGLIGNALTPLLSGGDIVLHPLGLLLAQNLGRLVDEHGIGFMSAVPAFWRLALKFSDAPAGSTLARVHAGSAPLSADLWKGIADWSRAEAVNCYGVTELANWVAGASSRVEGMADGLIGRLWGGEAAVRDSSGAIRAAGEGELLVKSPSVMSGYLHRPDLTDAALRDGWYHTGDIAAIDAAGLITLAGRIKDEINRAGLKVQPEEIDALLETHPAVQEACTFGIADAVSGEIVAAAVQLAPGANVTAAALADWCRARLRREAIPERWFMVDKLPRNERGKISRDMVRRALTGGDMSNRDVR
jgi:acyl-CoA synthetase (AMP-forming)/AMP-acid ligase II